VWEDPRNKGKPPTRCVWGVIRNTLGTVLQHLEDVIFVEVRGIDGGTASTMGTQVTEKENVQAGPLKWYKDRGLPHKANNNQWQWIDPYNTQSRASANRGRPWF
jgi:hypothetical protein